MNRIGDSPDFVPSDPLTDHEYDGIREFDNPTPGWWYAFFGATVVFSFCYLLLFHFSVAGWTSEDTWADDQRAEFKRVFGAVGQLKPDDDTIRAQMDNPQFMTIAKATFLGNCTACHGRDGGGLVGVNLCDDNYKNVKHISDIYKVITEGANGGAMPSWKRAFSDNERVILASYVASLRGTKPSAGKGPEGDPIAPWPAAKPK
ncbi:MAG: cbb3-type cytochrome c oxidase N-terminal domain-containing protein [Phycisphaerales bacterium]|nr:c-type cytochrome [Planctomycetota bacterium]